MPEARDEPTTKPVRVAAGRLPMLTEIIDVAAADEFVADVCGDAAAPAAAAPTPAAAVPDPVAAIDEARVVRRVLADLERQVDLLLEYRLREVLGPALARASDMLIRETRNELAATLRDIVARAVAHELARQQDQSR